MTTLTSPSLPYEVVLRLNTPFGPCVGVAIPAQPGFDDSIRARLAPEEGAFADAASPTRARSFVAGRLALRVAFRDAGLPPPPAVLPGPNGAPVLPAGVYGSISHKAALAVAIAGAGPGSGGLGIDLEDPVPSRFNIAPRVLRPTELASLSQMAEPQQGLQTRLAFSIKEAIYKAAFPVVQRFFGFQDAELDLPIAPQSDSFVTVSARLIPPNLSSKTVMRAATLLSTHRIISVAYAVGNKEDTSRNKELRNP